MAAWPNGMELEVELIDGKINCNAKTVGIDELNESIIEVISGTMIGKRFNSDEYILKHVFMKQKYPPTIKMGKWTKKGA